MKQNAVKIMVGGITISLILAAATSAYWIPDGIPVCDEVGDQYSHAVLPDGEGGMFVVWEDQRSSNYSDIYAQRVDADGDMQWADGGVAVCTHSGTQRDPMITADGTGGAFVLWGDRRDASHENLYVQRFDVDGNMLLAVDGVQITTYGGAGYDDIADWRIDANGTSGGAFVTWQDVGAGGQIYLTRITPTGEIHSDWSWYLDLSWDDSFDPQTIVWPGVGTVVAWVDSLESYWWHQVYISSVQPTGDIYWGGIAVCAAPECDYLQENVRLVKDGNYGTIVFWLGADGYRDLRAQRFDVNGNKLWDPLGVLVSGSVSYSMYDAEVIADGAGGAIAVYRGNDRIYAQRIDEGGNLLWGAGGVVVCFNYYQKGGPQITSDGAEGAIVTWTDRRNGYSDIYAQRVDFSGACLWEPNGVPVCLDEDVQSDLKIVSDEAGGAIVSWLDYRGSDDDIYAQRIDASGKILYYPGPICSIADVPGDQGGQVNLAWDPSPRDTLGGSITEYFVWRSVVSDPYSWSQVGSLPACHLEGYSMVVSTMADSSGVGNNYHHFKVVAHTADPSVYYVSDPDSGYSVDNLSPAPPLGLAGVRKISPVRLEITWRESADEDVLHYTVYRGCEAAFTPTSGNRLATTETAFYIDYEWSPAESYFYKISAVDESGRESECSLLRPDQITGDEVQTPVFRNYLAQNSPNPFNPSTTVEFGLERSCAVSLRIYDEAGRLVRILEDEFLQAGRHVRAWNGIDDGGRQVASGVYFCRLTAGDFTQTNKMILLR